MEIKDLAGLSEPLTRLIEVVSQGVGAVCSPYLLKKNTEARAYEISTISAALNKVAEEHQLPVVYKAGEVEVWQKPDDGTLTIAPKPLEDRTSLRINFQERKRQQNVENVTSIAAIELANEDSVPNEKPDEDWVSRFFSSAQDVSSEQMQQLWGRILAGEVRQPGKYSLRTLEFVRNITKAEADRIEHAGKLAITWGGTAFIAMQNKEWLKNQRNIYPGHQFALGELGAMYPTDLNLRMFREESIQEELFIAGESILLIKRGEIKNEMSLPIWKFTEIGKELLGLLPNTYDEDYLEAVAQFFVDNGGIVVIAKIIKHLPNGQIEYAAVREISKTQPSA